MAESLAFFSHIPKTAGSTLLKILISQYRRPELLKLYHNTAADREAAMKDLDPRIRMIATHHHLGLREKMPRPCHTITVLRDPVELAISLYYYIQASPTHHLHAETASGQKDLLAVARLERNRQVRWLAGVGSGAELSDAEVLDLAKANLLASDVTFGLAESFDESVIFFSRALGWRVKAFSKQNVTRDRPKRDQLKAGELAELEEICATDIALHRFAREKFDERVRTQPPEFAQELARLRQPSMVASAVAAVSRLMRVFVGIVALPAADLALSIV